LSQYKGVTVDASKNLATVKGGTLTHELQTALHPHKQFAAVGNVNTIGVIPYYLGGGLSIYKSLIGHGSDNIVSAKIITAKGDLVQVSEAQTPELLWGLRGAGQFLGLVTELTIKTHPNSLLGNDDGQRMCGTYTFLPQKVDAVCAALQKIMGDKQHVVSSELMALQAPSDLTQQVLVVAPQVFSSAAEATELFQPLVDAGPIQQKLVPSAFDKQSDHLDWIESFKRLVGLHAELVANCADAARSAYTIECHSPDRANLTEGNTSFGNSDVDNWANLISWYTDPANHDFVRQMDQKAQVALRTGTKQDAFISYTNTSREDPLEYRYKGADRIARLKALKKEFDPTGIFTKELL